MAAPGMRLNLGPAGVVVGAAIGSVVGYWLAPAGSTRRAGAGVGGAVGVLVGWAIAR